MKVVLTTLNAKYIHSSLALRYLQAYAKVDFPDAEIREYTIKDVPSRIVADLYSRNPDVIGFSVYIWNVEEIIPIARMLRKVLPNTKIVLGGPEVSYDTRYWMERVPEVDVIVQGEGEASFHHLLQVFDRKLSKVHGELADGASTPGTEDTLSRTTVEGFLADVPGIAYREEDGKIRINPGRQKLEMETIPSPWLESTELPALRDRIVYFETSRGCPFSCQFCLSSIESGVRYFPLERVKAELKRLIDAGVRTIKFVDRTFNLNRKYALDLFQFLIDNHKQMVFQFEITGDILPVEIVQFLTKNAPKGLFRFEIGIQSTNDVTNSLVKRRQNFEKLTNTILSIKESGKIVQHLDLIAGLPEESYESFKKTFNDVFAFEPDELQLGFLKMLRGTGLRLRAADFGYVYMDNAPYEIFSNHVLSYDEVLRIKQVEDVLEKYWNEGKLRNTVQYLTRSVFPTAFDFFQDFGGHWELNGWDRIGHQLEDLFLRLEGFLSAKVSREAYETARSYMMYDFLLQHRVRPHKLWWDRGLNRSARFDMARIIADSPEIFGVEFQTLGLAPEELDKHAVIDVLPRMICPGNPNVEVQNAPKELLLCYYRPGLVKGERPQMFLADIETSPSLFKLRDAR